jgi:hypothetical protein
MDNPMFITSEKLSEFTEAIYTGRQNDDVTIAAPGWYWFDEVYLMHGPFISSECASAAMWCYTEALNNFQQNKE